MIPRPLFKLWLPLVLLTLPVPAWAQPHLRLATTTSVENSGLLSALLPDFQRFCDCQVDVIAVGTGRALAIARRGDVDAVLVHAPAAERAFVTEGAGIRRVPFMQNRFVIVGPAEDPAGVRGKGASDAFNAIAQSQAIFLSRGDDSGTHRKELSFWKLTGTTPTGDWYREVGQGMGRTLIMAGELSAYTLTDNATFLALNGSGMGLHALSGDDKQFANLYSVIPVHPYIHPNIQVELAEHLAEWLTSETARRLIAGFTIGGKQPFVPLTPME